VVFMPSRKSTELLHHHSWIPTCPTPYSWWCHGVHLAVVQIAGTHHWG